MSAPAGRALIAESLRPALVALLALTAAGLLLLVGQSIQRAPVAPGLAGTLRVLLGLLPAVLGMALPVSLLFGLVAAARAWREGGDWLALSTAGHGARAVLGAVVITGLVGAAVQAAVAHWLEPLGRRSARLALVDASGDLRLQPGRPAVVGDVVLRAAAVDGGGLTDVVIAAGPRLVAARRGELLGAGRILLEEGQALGVDAAGIQRWRMEFGRAELALDPARPRVELGERSDAELWQAADRLDARGRDSGPQRMALVKRSSHAGCWPRSHSALKTGK